MNRPSALATVAVWALLLVLSLAVDALAFRAVLGCWWP